MCLACVVKSPAVNRMAQPITAQNPKQTPSGCCLLKATALLPNLAISLTWQAISKKEKSPPPTPHVRNLRW